MLLPPEPVRKQRAVIASRYKAGEITTADAGSEMIELEPESGAGYLFLGNARAEAGDLAGAESSYWKALERMPLGSSAYFAISEVRQKENADDPMAQRLRALAIWKLALRAEIPDELANLFAEQFGGKLPNPDTLDFHDPAIFEALAMAFEKKSENQEDFPEALRPYEQLNTLQQQVRSGMEAFFLEEILRTPSIALWRAALREWAARESAAAPDVVALMVALLGETGSPEILDDLLELSDYNNDQIFDHVSWAIWRVGQRFPEEALAQFRAAAPGARLTLRCALAEQILLLPETPGAAAVLAGLLEGFHRWAKQKDGAYLLARAIQGLERHKNGGEAARVAEEFQRLLPKQGREVLRKASRGALPSYIEEEIAGFTIEEICLDRVLMEPDEDEEEESEGDEEEEAITPWMAPARPGRNDPCWCCSGKKYKKCHLESDENAPRPAGGANPPAPEPLYAKLQRELIGVAKKRPTADFREAHRLYFGATPEEVESIPDDAAGGFVEWYIHDFRPYSTGRTTAEEYLRSHAGRLTSAERELLELWRDCRFGIWEVQRVEKGRGVELKDVFEGDRLFVDDVSSSRSMVRWDCLLSRFHKSEGKWYFVGNGLSIPRDLMPRLAEEVERGSREAHVTPAQFVRANSHRWHRMVKEFAEDRLAGLRIVNAEGDEIEFSTAEYRVEDEDALIAGLKKTDALEPEENGEPGVHAFAWLETENKGPRRSYGRIEIGKGKLRLECNSRNRLKNGRRLLEELTGAALVHLSDSFRSIDEIKREAGRGKMAPKSEKKASGIPPEIERELILKYKTQHYANWPDEPLPALGGRTPREAIRSEAGRREVEGLLRTMENNEERARTQGAAAFDFGVVRKSLGM